MNDGIAIWRTHHKVFVAFLDVLGFRQLVESNTHEQLELVYSDAFLQGLALGLSNRHYVIRTLNGRKTISNDVTAVPVNSLIASDNIIVWSNDDSEQAFRDIISVVRGMMAHSCLNGVPLRGAIELGPLSWVQSKYGSKTDNIQQSVFGKGLCQAYELEKDQQWSGCVIGEKAIDHFKAVCHGGLDDMVRSRELFVYNVPLKPNHSQAGRSGYVVDWVNHPDVGITESLVRCAFGQHGKLRGLSNEACQSVNLKIENTLSFVRKVAVATPWWSSPGSAVIHEASGYT